MGIWERRDARTKVDNIENLRAPIIGYTSEELAICARRDGDNGLEVSAVVLDELDAGVLLLP